jgi:FkbM family methyltransferase
MVLASGKLAFDIGANGGYVAKVLSRAFDKVVACEPAIESYQRLVPRCPVPNLECLNIAVSDHVGEVELGTKSWTESHGELFTGDSLADVWGPDTGRRMVECTTLDELVTIYGIPDFVKIDTEGHERCIVDGGMSVWKSHPQFIIEIHSEANGEYISGVLGDVGLKWDISRHESYKVGSYNYLNHYWMVSK